MSIKYKIAYMETLSERLKRRRKELRLTQKQIAQYVGVSSVAVTQWEQGLHLPSGKNLIRLAEAVKLTPSELLTGKKAKGAIQEESPRYEIEQLREDQIALLDAYERQDKTTRNAALRVLKVPDK